jgi:maltose/moltooligosaccharide transporter
MEKKKLTFAYLLLLALPGAFLELLNNVYNNYVPIFLQAGNASFAAKGTTLTFGFGVGAAVVGLWMVLDNVWGFFGMPIIGVWSDRSRGRRGRRLPFVMWTLPLVVLGYAALALVPTFIPAEYNGQIGRLTIYFVFFSLACIVYYLGFVPARVILQTIRQEAVESKDRTKVESWWNFGANLFTILALTAGAAIYKIYGPLLFWVLLVFYIIAALVLFFRYREAPELSQSATKQEGSSFKQLLSVFNSVSGETRRSLIWFLISVAFFTLASSAFGNFATSWAVNRLGVDEAKAASIYAFILIAATIVILPAGYLAAGKFGRRNMYLVGLLVMLAAAIFLVVVPGMFMAGFIVLGIGYGIGFSCQVPIATDLSSKEGNLGALIGVYNLAYLFGFVFGSLIMGWVVQTFTYGALFPTCAAFLAMATLTFLFVKAPRLTPAAAPVK